MRRPRSLVARTRPDDPGDIGLAVTLGPYLERTEDARFYEGGLPGRSVGDTLYSRSGLFLANDPQVRVATKATVGVTYHRSNGSEFTAALLETVTFADGSSLRCEGTANLSAFERFDTDIVLSAGDGTGSWWGWQGTQVTERTTGEPSQARRTWFQMSAQSRESAGSGPRFLPPRATSGLVEPVKAADVWPVLVGGERRPLEVMPVLDTSVPDRFAVFIVAAQVDDGGILPGLDAVLAPRLAAHQMPTGSAVSAGAQAPALGYLVLATPYGLARGWAHAGAHALAAALDPALPVAVSVEIAQAGGPPVPTPLDGAEPIRWGVDRGLLELVPLGPLANLSVDQPP